MARQTHAGRRCMKLIRLKVDVIVTRGTPATVAARNATRTIPIVMAAVGDPVASGIAASTARPGAMSPASAA